MMEHKKKQKCLKVIWSAIKSAQPNQGEIVIYTRKEDAALTVECLNIPQIQKALQSKDLTFLVKETSDEGFDIREQANATFYALFVAASLLSEKTARTAPKWLAMLLTHADHQIEVNGVAVAQAISRIRPVELLPQDDLAAELNRQFNDESLHKDFVKTAKGTENKLSVKKLIDINDKLLTSPHTVSIEGSLSSIAVLILLAESSAKSMDDPSNSCFKAVQEVTNFVKSEIAKRVPEAAELFTAANSEE